MFGIFPEKKSIEREGERVLPASIIIDQFEEKLYIPISYWDIDSYKAQWRESLSEGLKNRKHSGLAVTMYAADQTSFIFIWVAYFKGNDVFIQNSVLFMDDCPSFSPSKINEFIEPRMTHDEDGEKISEWRTDLASIITFFESLKSV